MTRRSRLRWVFVMMLSLLFQQAAFAAYVCPQTVQPAANTTMAAHCDGMPMAQSPTNTQTALTLCANHCAQPAPAAQNAQLPNLPAVALFAVLPAQSLVVTLPVSVTTYIRTARARAPGIAPALQYRVLLI